MRRKEIIKDAGIYTLSSYAAQIFDLINGILVRRFLGPTNMGIWAFLQVIQNYAKHAGLGVTMATARDVPYFLGKGDRDKAHQIQNLVFSFTLLTALVVALGIFAFAWGSRPRYSQPIFYGFVVVAVLIILQRLYNLFVVLLRSYKEFVFAGFLNIASSIASVFLTVLLAWKFRLYGFYVAVVLNYLLMLALILWRTPYRFSFHFDFLGLLPLLNLGLAVLFSDIFRTILMTIDRIMIAKFLGFEELGHYSIALMASNYLYSLPNMLSIIFFPHLQEVFAQRDRSEDLERFLREPTLCLAYLFPFLIGLAWSAATWLVPVVLPQYVHGIPALQYLVLGSFFTALSHSFSNFMITIKKQWQLVPLLGFSIVFGFALTGIFIQMGWGIQGVAFAGSLISLVYFLLLSSVSFRHIDQGKSLVFLYARLFGIFGAMTVALFFVNRGFYWLENGFFKFVLEYSVFFLLMSPFLWLAEKEMKIVSTLFMLLGNLSRQRMGLRNHAV